MESKWRLRSETTANELIQRIKSIGGKNICEYSKKRAAAIWLFLRGDARTLGSAGRANLREQFAQKWSRNTRDFEPQDYIQELPQPSEFERDHNEMWLKAFPREVPSPIPEQDMNEVLFIDGLFSCRGGKVCHGFEPQLQMQPTMVRPGQPGTNPMDIMNFAMQQFQMMCQQSGNNPLLTIYRQPQGRPMRSLQNMDKIESTHMMPPPLPPPATPPSADAGRVLAGTAAGSTHMTPPPALLPPADDIQVTYPMSAPPSPKLAASDERDAMQVTMKRMLERDKPPAPATPVLPEAQAAPKKTKTTPTKPKAGKIVKTTPAKPDRKKPCIQWETSRSQVMCRTGLSGPGSTHRITFKEAGGAKKAYALAEKWLAKEMKEYERTVLA